MFRKKRPIHLWILIPVLSFSLVFFHGCQSDTPESSNDEDQTQTVQTTTQAITTEKTDPVLIDKHTDEAFWSAFDTRLLSVREKGATGDGITDDTQAIQEALDAMEDGGTLFFPSGVYLVSQSLRIPHSNLQILGNPSTSHIVYTYEQRSSDAPHQASLFVLAPAISNVVFRHLKLEYRGEFFPKFGQSYQGAVSGIAFQRADDILIQHVEAFGFNANGIYAGTSSVAYSHRVRIDHCHLHHNRVAGVLFGNVDGFSITNSELSYNGSQPDGGTGYGCAGSSGAIPKNVQIIGNRANFNYRKGIDLHAGQQAIISDNICNGNRLYGIYTEGRNTAHIIISNNIITGMNVDELDIGPPYTWICGITIGVHAPEHRHMRHNFTVTGNIINDFGFENGDAYPFLVYHSHNNGHIMIKDNVVNAGRISNIIRFSRRTAQTEDFDLSVDISGNHAHITGEVLYSAFRLDHVAKLTMAFNTVTFEKPVTHPIVEKISPVRSHTYYAFNHITAPEYDHDSEVLIRNKTEHTTIDRLYNTINNKPS